MLLAQITYQDLLEKLKTDLLSQSHLFPTALFGWILLGLAVVLVLVAVIWALCALEKVYGVWSAHKDGQADLAQAHNEQLIQVAQAKGRLQAAELNKEAEIIDASAVAKSVEIIGKALHENHGYLQWKWIHMMEQRDSGDTIYVPTEASLPILEAGRRNNKPTDLT